MVKGFKTVVGGGPQFPRKNSEKRATLVIIAGHSIGKIFRITHEKTTLGRGEQCDFMIPDSLISRRHAVITKEKEVVRLKDLNSTNGTYLNFHSFDNAPLKDGDYINMGTTIVKFLYSDSPEAQFHDEIYKLASLDGLTQIYNKKHFKELFEKELSRTTRHNIPLSLCMIDIDFFKQINDTYGHQAGDFVLSTMARDIRQELRKEDIFARYGGEEFCLLLPSTTAEACYTKANRIRETVANKQFLYNKQTISVTVSIGIYTIENKEKMSVDDCIERADQKLYVSKQEGRNRVTM